MMEMDQKWTKMVQNGLNGRVLYFFILHGMIQQMPS